MGNVELKGSEGLKRSPRKSPRPPMPLPNSDSKKTYRFDVFIVGDFGCGKTSLALYFLREQIREPLVLQTQRYRSREIDMGSIGKASLKFLDTLGQERYSTIPIATYQRSDIILVAFDLTNRESFSNLRAWYSEAKLHSHGKAVIALVGCKSDLSSERQVKRNEVMMEFQSPENIIYLETSAITGDNVQLLFERVVSKLIEYIRAELIPYSDTNSLESGEYKQSVSPQVGSLSPSHSQSPTMPQEPTPPSPLVAHFRASVSSSRRVVLTNSPAIGLKTPITQTKVNLAQSAPGGASSGSDTEEPTESLDSFSQS